MFSSFGDRFLCRVLRRLNSLSVFPVLLWALAWASVSLAGTAGSELDEWRRALDPGETWQGERGSREICVQRGEDWRARYKGKSYFG